MTFPPSLLPQTDRVAREPARVGQPGDPVRERQPPGECGRESGVLVAQHRHAALQQQQHRHTTARPRQRHADQVGSVNGR